MLKNQIKMLKIFCLDKNDHNFERTTLTIRMKSNEGSKLKHDFGTADNASGGLVTLKELDDSGHTAPETKSPVLWLQPSARL